MSATDRYRIVGRMGTGSRGVVYRVQDRASGETLAMKVMSRERGSTHLANTFLPLARLRHPNLVAIHDYGLNEAGHDFVITDYVDGPPLHQAISEVPSPAFYGVVAGVLRALAFVHRHKMVHANLKPSNILIEGAHLAAAAVRAPRLGDLGLATHFDNRPTPQQPGISPWAAPEAFTGHVDARADLYALGAVMYQLATGSLPFSVKPSTDMVPLPSRGAPIDPRRHRGELPRGLAELILALLDPAPGARPQSAAEVLSRLDDIAGAKFAVEESPPFVDPGTTFVGREPDRGQLLQLWAHVRRGHGRAVLLSGEAGIGKSRLLEQLTLAVELDGGRVFRVRGGVPDDAPYAGLASLVRMLLATLPASSQTSSPQWHSGLRSLFGQRTEELARAEEYRRYALAEAFTQLVFDVASRGAVVIGVDDVDRADGATLDLLSYLTRAVAESAVLLAMTARPRPMIDTAVEPQQAYQGSSLTKARAFHRLVAAVRDADHGVCCQLEPLDEGDIGRIVSNQFGGDIAEKITADLARTSRGNPWLVVRTLQALVDDGTLLRKPGRWTVGQEPRPTALPSDSADAALQWVERQPPTSQKLVEIAAVVGDPARRDMVAELAAEPGVAQHLDGVLADCVAAGVLCVDAAAGTFCFVHREVAAALRQRILATREQELHRHAAALLERGGEEREEVFSERIARHLLAAEDKRAVKTALRAARQRLDHFDYHGALAWYAMVRPQLRTRPAAAEVDERLGDLYSLLGERNLACAAYVRSYEALADSPQDHIRVALRLAELRRQMGGRDAALDILMAALQEARQRDLAGEEARCHLRIGWMRVYQADYRAAHEHAVTGHLLARCCDDAVVSAELGRLRAAIDIVRDDAKSALTHLQTALTDAEPTGDDVLRAALLHACGGAAIRTLDYGRAVSWLEKAIQIAEKIGHIEQLALSLNSLGAACYFLGDWEQARSAWERFARLCQRIHDGTELVNALNNLGTLYRELGQFRLALTTLDRAAVVAETEGQAYMVAMVLGNRGEALFRSGDLAGARRCYARALAEFEGVGARENVIENRRRISELELAAGNLKEALERAIDTARLAKEAGTRLEEGILYRIAANALRLQGDFDSATWFIGEARDLFVKLGSRAERAKLELEAAELAAARGQLHEAQELLDAAAAVFCHLGARWQLERARALQLQLVPSECSSREEGSALDLLRDLAPAIGETGLERFLEHALDRILKGSDFERGVLFVLDRQGLLNERLRRSRSATDDARDLGAAVTAAIARRVATTGDPISIENLAEDGEFFDQTNTASLGPKGVFCAPMRCRGRIVGALYLDRSKPEIAVATTTPSALEALAGLLALAIENARMMGEERRQADLLAVLAHEIRNPLSGIIGYSDMGEVDPGQFGFTSSELFANIRRDAARLERLAENLLELARHENGSVDSSMFGFDMIKLIEDVVSSYRPQCSRKQISLASDTTGLDVPARGNPDRIAQVLSNLIGNAVKFTPARGRIVVTARREGGQLPENDVQQFIRVDVSDSGPGLTAEARERLFRKFAQGESDKRSAGIGLGLYISRHIIAGHGGSIFVQSEPGKGSVFSFRIPLTPDRG